MCLIFIVISKRQIQDKNWVSGGFAPYYNKNHKNIKEVMGSSVCCGVDQTSRVDWTRGWRL